MQLLELAPSVDAITEAKGRIGMGVVLKAQVLDVDALVEWAFRSGTGYGRVSGYSQKGVDSAHTLYNLHVFYRHRSASGELEPATRQHWGTNVHPQPKARELAQAQFDKFKGTKQEGVLSL